VARTVSLANLRTWARQLSDTEYDSNVTDSELTALANRHLTEVYDRLVDAGPADYYAATTQITTIAGTTQYGLPADFRNLVKVYVEESSDERRQLFPLPDASRGRVKAPQSVYTVDLEYIPTAPMLVSDSDTFDGVSGWEELIANFMARDVMRKQQRDPSFALQAIAMLEARITNRARQRDKGGGKRTTDLDEALISPFPWGWTGQTKLAAYRIFGDNLELYETLWGLP